MSLLEHHVLHQGLGDDVLLFDRAVLLLLLTDDHSLGLRLEQHAARGDRGGGAVVLLRHADGGEAHLEDADAVEVDLLAQFEEVLHGLAQLLQHGDDVTALHRCLRLDESRQLLGLDKLLVIHGLRIVLAIGGRLVVLVLCLNVLLTHDCKNLKMKH